MWSRLALASRIAGVVALLLGGTAHAASGSHPAASEAAVTDLEEVVDFVQPQSQPESQPSSCAVEIPPGTVVISPGVLGLPAPIGILVGTRGHPLNLGEAGTEPGPADRLGTLPHELGVSPGDTIGVLPGAVGGATAP